MLEFYIAVTAFVFRNVLMEPGMIFSFYARFLDRLPEYVSKPLGGCTYCFGGQVALWYFIFTQPFSVPDMVFFVSLTIFFIYVAENRLH